ncbi:MAG: hypothetical protein HDT26_07595 [Subdoligranulum sp.]|nr:hypothetical protein [Subdoligranulum sp.]
MDQRIRASPKAVPMAAGMCAAVFEPAFHRSRSSIAVYNTISLAKLQGVRCVPQRQSHKPAACTNPLKWFCCLYAKKRFLKRKVSFSGRDLNL